MFYDKERAAAFALLREAELDVTCANHRLQSADARLFECCKNRAATAEEYRVAADWFLRCHRLLARAEEDLKVAQSLLRDY